MHTPLPQWAVWSEVAIRFSWAALAAAIWIVMSRRGHDGAIWALVGVVLGPLAVPAAIVSARRASRRLPIVIDEGTAGEIGVLAVVDPDRPDTWAAEAEQLNALRGPTELVVVVSRETLDVAARDATVHRARAALAAVASAVAGPAPRQVILEGRPTTAVAHRRDLLGGPIVVTPASRLGDRLRFELAASSNRRASSDGRQKEITS